MQCLGAVWENQLLMTEKGNKRYSGAPLVVKDGVIIDADGGELSVSRTIIAVEPIPAKSSGSSTPDYQDPLILAEPFDRRLQRPGGYPILC